MQSVKNNWAERVLQQNSFKKCLQPMYRSSHWFSAFMGQIGKALTILFNSVNRRGLVLLIQGKDWNEVSLIAKCIHFSCLKCLFIEENQRQ